MATGAPGTNGVWQYGEDDSEATFSALLNKAAGTTDTAIGLDRARLTTLEAKPLSGLVPVVPSSVDKSGGTASYNSLGQVTFSGVASISLNGIFTTAYANYKIIFKGNATSAGAIPKLKYRAAGTDTATNLYYSAGNWARTGGTTGVFGQNAATEIDFGRLDSTSDYRNGFTVEVYDPKASKVTTHTSLWAGQDGTGIISGYANGFYAASTQYDGFTLYPSAGTIQGLISVYGYND